MNTNNEFSQLLTALYTSTVNLIGWRSLAARLAQSLGAHSCQLGVVSPTPEASQRTSWTDNYTAPLNAAYRAKYHAHDPWVAWVRRIQPGSLVTGNVATIDPGFMKTEIYNDYCHPLGIYHVVGAGVSRRSDGSVDIIGLHRERSAGAFGAKQRHRLQSLLPHLQQAMLLRETIGRLRLEGCALFTALESMHLGVMIVDLHGHLLFADSTAESILRSQNQISVRNGRVHLAEPGRCKMLLKLIAEAAFTGGGDGTGAGGFLTLHASVANELRLRVSPFPVSQFSDSLQEPAAIVYLRCHNPRPIPLQHYLRQTYGLTRTEARLAEALAFGCSLAQYSEEANVSLNTTKTLNKRIYAKTGHRSRSEFMRDVLNNPLLLMAAAKPSR